MSKNLLIILVLVVVRALWWGLSAKDKDNNVVDNQALRNTVVIFKTNQGDIWIELLADQAPQTVENFLKLARTGFYDGTMFHRVIKGFMIQGGDPSTKTEPKNWAIHGRGGPDYQFADEFNGIALERGILAMANAGPNTNGSQFFIVTAPKVDWLNTREPGVGWHTPFGRVTKGLDIITKIENTKTDENDHPLENVIVEQVIEAEGEIAQ